MCSPNHLEKCISDVVRIGNIMLLSFIWVGYEKPSSSYSCDVMFLVRLQGNFEIDHSWEWIRVNDSLYGDTTTSRKCIWISFSHMWWICEDYLVASELREYTSLCDERPCAVGSYVIRPYMMYVWLAIDNLYGMECSWIRSHTRLNPFSQPFKEKMHKWDSENLYYNHLSSE